MAQHPTDSAAASVGWDALLKQYGLAMQRLGQLEEEVTSLQGKLGAQPSQAHEDPGLRQLVEQKDRELRHQSETIATLRLQTTSLTNELERVKQELRLASRGAYARIRRRHRSRWWQVWRNRWWRFGRHRDDRSHSSHRSSSASS